MEKSATPYVYDWVSKSFQGYQADSGGPYLGLRFLSLTGYGRKQVPHGKAVLLWCYNITSHLVNTLPPRWALSWWEWGGSSEKGLERGGSNKRREDRGRATQHLKKTKRRTHNKGKGSNAKPVESEHRHWGNQKSSESVCVVGGCVCVCVYIYVCSTLTRTNLPKQSTTKPKINTVVSLLIPMTLVVLQR